MTYRTEDEILENVKSWWKKYGNYFLYGTSIILVIFITYKWLERRETATLDNSSVIFDQATNNETANNKASLQANANTLIKEYPKTIYADFMRLKLAKKALDGKQHEKAKKELNYLVKHAKDASIKNIARIRLARIELDANNNEKALKILGNIKGMDFYLNEIRGDIYRKQKDFAKSRKFYELSLKQRKGKKLSEGMLAIKLENLPPTS